MTLRSELISVVIPVRDRATVVGPTLASLAAQTMAPARIVLVDNGSTDGTAEVLHRWAESRTDTIVVSEPTPGAARARNRGLAEVTTPYVLFFDSDDLMPVRHIAEVTSALHASGLPSLATFSMIIKTLDGKTLIRGRRRGDPLFNQIFHASLCTATTIIKTDIINETGGWNSGLMGWDDYEIGIRLLCRCGKPVHINISEPVIAVSSEESITGTDFFSRHGIWEQALNSVESILIKENKNSYTKYIDYRRAILAGMYRREGHPELATPLLAKVTHRPRLMRLIAAYVARGGRGVAHIAKIFH